MVVSRNWPVQWLSRIFRARPVIHVATEVPSTLIVQSAYEALLEALEPTNSLGHEGIVFLLGRVDGPRTICMQSVRPRARTTPGSFRVSAIDMARVVGLATTRDLQIVGQIHTHPGDAFHSDGDEDGANIRFEGFTSIVIPFYGIALPHLTGSAVYRYQKREWISLPLSSVSIIAGGVLL